MIENDFLSFVEKIIDKNTQRQYDKYLEEKIRGILSEMITEDHVVVAYKGKSPVVNMAIKSIDIPADVEDVETPSAEDDIDDIKAAIAGW